MPVGRDPAAAFLRLLEYCAITHRLVSRSELQTLQGTPHPCNPLDIDTGSDRRELRFAMKQGFDRVLQSSFYLDWDRVKTGTQEIEQHLAEQEENRIDARVKTRWATLAQRNPYFDFCRWSACWSRRHLEGVLGFFTDDAVYVDTARNYAAEGKTELRGLFSRLFHASEGALVVDAAKFVPADSEIELEWVLTGSRVPGPDMSASLGGGTVHGKSNLWVEGGRILTCIDSPDEEDLKKIAMASVGARRPATAGTVRQTPTAVYLDRIVLLKQLKWKGSRRSRTNGRTHDSR